MSGIDWTKPLSEDEPTSNGDFMSRIVTALESIASSLDQLAGLKQQESDDAADYEMEWSGPEFPSVEYSTAGLKDSLVGVVEQGGE